MEALVGLVSYQDIGIAAEALGEALAETGPQGQAAARYLSGDYQEITVTVY